MSWTFWARSATWATHADRAGGPRVPRRLAGRVHRRPHGHLPPVARPHGLVFEHERAQVWMPPRSSRTSQRTAARLPRRPLAASAIVGGTVSTITFILGSIAEVTGG